MSSPFLLSFTASVVDRLLANGDLVLTGPRDAVVHHVAGQLGSAGDHSQLIATLSAALLSSPDVDDLYADDDALKDLVTALPRTVLRRGVP
jgi:hypothetical protein